MAQDPNALIWIDMEMSGLNPETDRVYLISDGGTIQCLRPGTAELPSFAYDTAVPAATEEKAEVKKPTAAGSDPFGAEEAGGAMAPAVDPFGGDAAGTDPFGGGDAAGGAPAMEDPFGAAGNASDPFGN